MFNLINKVYYKDWIYKWLINQKKFIKESTYANYSSIVFNHLISKLGNYSMNELTNNLLQEFLLDLFQSGRIDNKGGLSEKTVKDIATVIKCSLKKAMNQNVMKQINLDFYYPKNNSKNKIYVLSKTEQRKITNYILDNRNNRNIGILISLYSGIRIGELCALKWSDINFKKGYISINKTLQRIYIKDKEKNVSKVIISTPKTQNANRDIPLNNEISTILLNIKGKPNEYVLSGTSECIEPRTYRKFFNKFLTMAKINHINFHSLRHTFATNCIRLGVDYKTVSELLGHANVNITLNLYVHPQMSQKKKCINLVCKDFIKK